MDVWGSWCQSAYTSSANIQSPLSEHLLCARPRGVSGTPEAGAADGALELKELSKRLEDALVLTEDPVPRDAPRFAG